MSKPTIEEANKGSLIAERLTHLFSSNSLPEVGELLDKIAYVSADDEPVNIANRLYPFEPIMHSDTYYVAEIFYYLSPIALIHLVPRLAAQYLLGKLDIMDNLSEKVTDFALACAPESEHEDPFMDRKVEAVRGLLTDEQRKVLGDAGRLMRQLGG